MLNNITPVVKDILLINIVMFFGTMLIFSDTGNVNQMILSGEGDLKHFGPSMLAVFYPSSNFFRSYQIVTHLFMHGGFTHLFFNMFGLIMLGPVLENVLGPKRFLIFYLTAGIGGLFLYMFIRYLEMNYFGAPSYYANVPMLGASGAIFAIMTGFATLFPNQELRLLFPPVALKAKYFILIYIGIELFLGLGRFHTGIAHFAHLSGALIGFILIKFWKY